MEASHGVGSFLLLLLLAASGSATEESDQIVVSYLQCVNVQSLDLRTMFLFPLNQSELDRPGPSACAANCTEIDPNYTYFLVHVPAKGQFTNKLVCGCGYAKALDNIPFLPDKLCHLPCPLGNGSSVVNAIQLSNGKPSQQVIDPWLPSRPGEQQQQHNDTARFFGGKTVNEGGTTSNRRRTYSSTLMTCGNGLGFVSAYQVMGLASSLSPAQLLFLVFLPILLL